MSLERCWPQLSEDSRAQFWACLALKHSKGIGARTAMRLVHHFHSPLVAVQQSTRWREAGVGGNCAAALQSNAWRETALEEWKAAQRAGASILLWGDKPHNATD